MSSVFRCVKRWPWTAAAVLMLLAHLPAHAVAQVQALDPQLKAMLDAGEFAPAIDAARRAPAAVRNAWLAQVAGAQAQAGQPQAALRSAADIRDDRLRAQTLAGAATVPVGGQGGGAQPDFDSLIDLITSTVQPTTWDTVGGPGSIAPFPTGVLVEPQGLMKPLLKEESGDDLAALRKSSARGHSGRSVRRPAALRMISLPRLEKHIQLLAAAGRGPDEAMQVLAGLQRIKYVFVYPESGDLVIAGPAGDWQPGPEQIIVSTETGLPVVRLDDLVVVFRLMLAQRDAKFGCMITPTQEALARAKKFLAESGQHSIRPQDRKAWLERLRRQLGQQEIEVYGLDPRTRAARIMVEADYRMKLVGMGLEPGVPGVESYLDSVKVPPGQAPPPMGVLRWWFTLNYDAIAASRDRQAFEIRGQGVQVQSENERLTAEGKRVHTGESDELNRKFAHSFTKHFAELCAKYPIYAELRNLCDLALVGALVREEKLAEKNNWHLVCFSDPAAFPVELGDAPKTVETVINHRVINRIHILAGVSGGVRVHPTSLVSPTAIQPESQNTLATQRTAAAQPVVGDAWWWDP